MNQQANYADVGRNNSIKDCVAAQLREELRVVSMDLKALNEQKIDDFNDLDQLLLEIPQLEKVTSVATQFELMSEQRSRSNSDTNLRISLCGPKDRPSLQAIENSVKKSMIKEATEISENTDQAQSDPHLDDTQKAIMKSEEDFNVQEVVSEEMSEEAKEEMNSDSSDMKVNDQQKSKSYQPSIFNNSNGQQSGKSGNSQNNKKRNKSQKRSDTGPKSGRKAKQFKSKTKNKFQEMQEEKQKLRKERKQEQRERLNSNSEQTEIEVHQVQENNEDEEKKIEDAKQTKNNKQKNGKNKNGQGRKGSKNE